MTSCWSANVNTSSPRRCQSWSQVNRPLNGVSPSVQMTRLDPNAKRSLFGTPISQFCGMLSPSVPYGLAQVPVSSQPADPSGISVPGCSVTSYQSRVSLRSSAGA